MHPEDKIALDNLNALPVFPAILKAFMKAAPEELLHGQNLAQKIRLSSEQLPEIYGYLPPICKVLGIAVPEFYLEMSPTPNAYTFGDTNVFVTVTSGLLEYLEEDELKAVIAHECGHIACRHVLYNTLAHMLFNYGSKILGPLATVSEPVLLALSYWQRRSEMSADRAAAIYMKSSKSVVDTMIRLAGGSKYITGKVNLELYLQQAEEYDKLVRESFWNRILQGYAVMNSSHPFLAVRSNEIAKWTKSEHYSSILKVFEEDLKYPKCIKCGERINPEWEHCRFCGTCTEF